MDNVGKDIRFGAEVDRDGITVSQERTIKLQSGQVADVTIDFPTTQLASANGTR